MCCLPDIVVVRERILLLKDFVPCAQTKVLGRSLAARAATPLAGARFM